MRNEEHKSSLYGVKGIKVLWALFAVFILYTTLVPFSTANDFQQVKSNITRIKWSPFAIRGGPRVSIADVVQNVILFLPFGFLGVLTFRSRRDLTQVFKVTSLGFLLSCTVEILQLLTRTRTTSTTDIITNTCGTFIGATLTVSILGSYLSLQHSHRFNQFRSDKYFALLVMTTFVVVAGALQPFDFSVSANQILAKLGIIKATAFSFSTVLSDQGVVLLRTFLFGFIWCTWLSNSGLRNAAVKALVFSVLIAVACETAQIVVRARIPGFADAVVIATGCSMGVAFTRLKLIRVKPVTWSSAIMAATIISVAMQVLSPFKLDVTYTDINWIPFLAHDERTTFVALSNFIESMLMFFPMGFILQYHNHRTKVSLLLIGVSALMIALPLELLQGWITGRNPDITEVLGALMGALTAAGLCLLWYYEFDRHRSVEGIPKNRTTLHEPEKY